MWDLWVYSPRKSASHPMSRNFHDRDGPFRTGCDTVFENLGGQRPDSPGIALCGGFEKTSLTSWWRKPATQCSRIQRCTMIDESMMIRMIYEDLWKKRLNPWWSMKIITLIYDDLWKNTDAMSPEHRRAPPPVGHGFSIGQTCAASIGWFLLTQRTLRPCQGLGRLVSLCQGLIYGRYLQFRILKFPLILVEFLPGSM